MLNSVAIAGSQVNVAATSAGVALLSAPFEIDATAATDLFAVDVWQNSGTSLAVVTWVSLKWIQST